MQVQLVLLLFGLYYFIKTLILDGIKMSIKAVSDNSVSNDNLHRMDTDMTPKSIGIVFVLIIIGLIGVFYSFLAGGNLSTGMTLLYIVVGIIVAVGMGFFRSCCLRLHGRSYRYFFQSNFWYWYFRYHCFFPCSISIR